MNKIFSLLSICFFLQSCLTFVAKSALETADANRNKGKNETCNIETYRNYDGKYYNETILPYIAIPEIFAGLYGIYYFYPNGLKMFGSFFYYSIATDQFTDKEEKPRTGKKRGWYETQAFAAWNQVQDSKCQNQSDFFSYSNILKVEIDLTKKEYSQIQGNDFSNQKTFESVCKNNQSSLEEDLYNRLFLLYEEEIIEIKSERNRYRQSEEEAKSIEDRIDALNKKKFTRQQILSILRKENLKYEVYVESVNFEYPKTVTCSLTYYLQYTGGKDAFKKKMETYFKK